MIVRKPNALVACVVLLLGCNERRIDLQPSQEDPLASQYTDITVARLQEMMVDPDFVLVNVHIPFEGDLPGTTVTIPFDEISFHLDKLPRDLDGKVVVYCRSGRMSSEASATLASLGYTKVFNLTGGMRAWKAAGLELEGDRGP